MLSICDIVLNHTANESPFLILHPECTYNCVNNPHLRPAYILDAALFELSAQVAAGEWEFKGIPVVVETEDHLNVSYQLLYFFSITIEYQHNQNFVLCFSHLLGLVYLALLQFFKHFFAFRRFVTLSIHISCRLQKYMKCM